MPKYPKCKDVRIRGAVGGGCLVIWVLSLKRAKFLPPMAGWLMSSWVIKAFVINTEGDLSTCKRNNSGCNLVITSGLGSCKTRLMVECR